MASGAAGTIEATELDIFGVYHLVVRLLRQTSAYTSVHVNEKTRNMHRISRTLVLFKSDFRNLFLSAVSKTAHLSFSTWNQLSGQKTFCPSEERLCTQMRGRSRSWCFDRDDKPKVSKSWGRERPRVALRHPISAEQTKAGDPICLRRESASDLDGDPACAPDAQPLARSPSARVGATVGMGRSVAHFSMPCSTTPALRLPTAQFWPNISPRPGRELRRLLDGHASSWL